MGDPTWFERRLAEKMKDPEFAASYEAARTSVWEEDNQMDIIKSLQKYLTQPGHDAPAYSLPWLAAFRKDAYARMESLAGVVRPDTPAIKGKRTTLARLEAEASVLRAAIKAFEGPCPHPLDNMTYSENGREDSYGSHLPGRDIEIRCTRCRGTVDEWREER